MLNRLKTSLVLIPIVFLLVVGAYIYSLWAADRQRSADLPVEGASTMMRDLLGYHKKRGGFPSDLKELEGVIWEKKNRQFTSGNRALSHRNYYYRYALISNHQFTLWAIPFGRSREESPTWFLSVTTESCRRWKGPALPLEQVGKIDSNPSLRDLGVVGLIEQPPIDLESKTRINGYQRF